MFAEINFQEIFCQYGFDGSDMVKLYFQIMKVLILIPKLYMGFLTKKILFEPKYSEVFNIQNCQLRAEKSLYVQKWFQEGSSCVKGTAGRLSSIFFLEHQKLFRYLFAHIGKSWHFWFLIFNYSKL